MNYELARQRPSPALLNIPQEWSEANLTGGTFYPFTLLAAA